MPRESELLSALAVKRLPEGVHAVGGVAGLLLQVRDSGARSWLLRAVIGGRRREMGLGPYPEVSLSAARTEAARMRALIREGRDPIRERQDARAALVATARKGKTFAEVLDEYASEKLSEIKEEKYRKQWQATVRNYALPVLGDMSMQDIGLDDVLQILTPIWHEKTETASKLQGRIEKLIAFAIAKGYRDGSNPALWKNNLSLLLPSPSKVSDSENYPALQLEDGPRWWSDLQGREGMGARALEFQAMTVSRSGAVRFATWDEINLNTKIWTIQPGRKASKIKPQKEGGRAHKVPLTKEMIALLEALPRFEGCALVFPSPTGKDLSDATLGKVMETIHKADIRRGGPGYLDEVTGKPAVPHGLRATFRTWASNHTNYEDAMAEIALAHRVGTKTAQAYDRAHMVEKRRGMMEIWMKRLTTGK